MNQTQQIIEIVKRAVNDTLSKLMKEDILGTDTMEDNAGTEVLDGALTEPMKHLVSVKDGAVHFANEITSPFDIRSLTHSGCMSYPKWGSGEAVVFLAKSLKGMKQMLSNDKSYKGGLFNQFIDRYNALTAETKGSTFGIRAGDNWCAAFACVCLYGAGKDNARVGLFTANCINLAMNAYKKHIFHPLKANDDDYNRRRGVIGDTYVPRPGDIMIFYNNKLSSRGHAAIVESYKNQILTHINGNVSEGGNPSIVGEKSHQFIPGHKLWWKKGSDLYLWGFIDSSKIPIRQVPPYNFVTKPEVSPEKEKKH